MQRQTGAGAAGKQDSGERGDAEKMLQHSDAMNWPASMSSTSTALEQSPEQVKLFQDFREHFEAFYRGEPFRQKPSGAYNSSGRDRGPLFASASGVDSAYAYNSDDEYVDNLRQSGNFSSGAIADYKDDAGRTRATHFQLTSSAVVDPGARQEIDYYKSFDNIFDLVDDPPAAPGEDQLANKADAAHFYQYSFENLHKRTGQAALARQGKRKSPAMAPVSPPKKSAPKPQAARSPAKVAPPAPKQTVAAAKKTTTQGSGRSQ